MSEWACDELLQAVATGQTMTAEQYAETLSVVRRDKRRVAREVLVQYAPLGETN